eukprot:CAMPEP_0172695630 /NCGR_PEP_ID=MMETSP1074-20121228/27483_1 /TAXON_ID=2916 /ORGANISM="Ceratium fusus, Strain PA161109" /LENGTH=200 /DNA_ID=CAMNT_0013516275 /DNA_START=26 /DNA_END=624 /DNA_ORIENTATION=-
MTDADSSAGRMSNASSVTADPDSTAAKPNVEFLTSSENGVEAECQETQQLVHAADEARLLNLQALAKQPVFSGLGVAGGAASSGDAAGGLGAGSRLPTATSLPQSWTPVPVATEQSVDGSKPDGLPQQQQQHLPHEQIQQPQQQVPLAKSTHRNGRLRTTVNTPQSLITEVDVDVPLDPGTYMHLTQQYAALSQQYAAYA